MGKAVADLFSRWEQGSLPTLRNPEFPARFERRELTRRLAGMYQRILGQTRPPGGDGPKSLDNEL